MVVVAVVKVKGRVTVAQFASKMFYFQTLHSSYLFQQELFMLRQKKSMCFSLSPLTHIHSGSQKAVSMQLKEFHCNYWCRSVPMSIGVTVRLLLFCSYYHFFRTRNPNNQLDGVTIRTMPTGMTICQCNTNLVRVKQMSTLCILLSDFALSV